MSRNEFLDRIKLMDPMEHEATTQKAEAQNINFTRRLEAKSKVRRIAKIAKTLGFGKAFVSSSGGISGRESTQGHTQSHNSPTQHTPTHSPRGFSVYDINEIDIANARDYYRGVDGKGDHDCGHEH